MRFFHNQNTKSFRTKPLNNFLFCLILIIIPGLILWLFFGYINFSYDFLVFPAYGVIASGNNEQIIQHLNLIYSLNHVYAGIRLACYDLSIHLTKYPLNGYNKLNLANFDTSYYSPLIAAVIVPYIFWSLITPFLFKFTKLINYDLISFSLTCCLAFVMLLITAAIPVASINNNTFYNHGGLIILARIVIVAVSCVFSFFISNRIVMLLLKTSKDEKDYYLQLTDETLKVQNETNLLRTKRKEQIKENKEPNYVEIDEKQISLRNKKKNFEKDK